MRRKTLNKIEQLTGEKPPVQSSKSTQAEKGIRTELVTVNGIQYAVNPATTNSNETATQPATRQPPTAHHILPDLVHHGHENTLGQGVYVPPRRLDEWKKGGVALLAGPLLDLDVIDQSEAEKDKTWWEAGNTGKR